MGLGEVAKGFGEELIFRRGVLWFEALEGGVLSDQTYIYDNKFKIILNCNIVIRYYSISSTVK